MHVVLAAIFSFAFTLAAQEHPPPDQLSTERIVFITNLGTIVVGLFPQAAPKHAAQMMRLAELGVFDGTRIFRVEKGFVAQIENYDARKIPLSDDQRAAVVKLPLELSALVHDRGVLSMAHFDEDVNSGETSFSFLLGPAPHLDGKYTIFGRVTAGWDTLAAIEAVGVGEDNKPLEPLLVQKAELVRDGSKWDQSPPFRWTPYLVGALLVGILGAIFVPRRR